MFRIRQTDKGQLMFPEIALELLLTFRPDDDNYRIASHKFIMITAQLRHVRAAVRSDEAAVKNQQHILFATKI